MSHHMKLSYDFVRLMAKICIRNFEFYFILYVLSAQILVLSNPLKGCKPFEIIVPIACGSEEEARIPEFRSTPDRAIFMHTREKSCYRLFDCCKIIRDLQEYHMHTLGWPDVGYNFLVGSDGRVYIGRGWKQVGQFSHFYNDKSLSIVFIGNYYDRSPTKVMVENARSLLECAMLLERLARNYTVHMHEDIECTKYPAPALKKEIASWFRYEEKVKDYIDCESG